MAIIRQIVSLATLTLPYKLFLAIINKNNGLNIKSAF